MTVLLDGLWMEGGKGDLKPPEAVEGSVCWKRLLTWSLPTVWFELNRATHCKMAVHLKKKKGCYCPCATSDLPLYYNAVLTWHANAQMLMRRENIQQVVGRPLWCVAVSAATGRNIFLPGLGEEVLWLKMWMQWCFYNLLWNWGSVILNSYWGTESYSTATYTSCFISWKRVVWVVFDAS